MRTLFLTFVSALFFCSATAQTGEKNFIDQNYIEVTGVAEREIIPDMIYLTIIIDEKNISGKGTVESVEKLMIERLKALGIDVSKELALQDFSGDYKSYILKKDGLVANKTYQLLVHDAKMVSNVFQELDKMGVTNITISKLNHSKIIQFKKEVRVEAVKAAKEKAQYLTTAVDQSIGRAIFIFEQNAGLENSWGRTRNGIMANSLSFSKNDDDDNFEFEKIKLSYSVLVRFELK